MSSTTTELNNSPLGKESSYISTYTPTLLFGVSRRRKRQEIGISSDLPFYGVDIWNAYEVSWLNPKGKPQVAVAEFIFPHNSTYLIESKSFKLYLNSLNQTQIESREKLSELLARDLSIAAEGKVQVKLLSFEDFTAKQIETLSGVCLDNLDIDCKDYVPQPCFLATSKHHTKETLISNLLKSNCLITRQPDWASIQISYEGPQIEHEGLLRYLVSFRNHDEFHEQCVERIFTDIMRQCGPSELTVYARYTRRGGLDINPFRSTSPHMKPENLRLFRQ